MTHPPHIMVVDDKRDLADGVAMLLGELSPHVTVAYSAEEALARARGGPVDLLFSDVRMPGGSGVDLLRQVHALWPHCRVVLFTAYATIEDAVAATRLGAYEYLTKPFDNEHLLVVARRALDDLAAEDEIHRLRAALDERHCFHGMHGRDRRMLRVFEAIRRVAAADAPVMICGESGTGKELAARALHALGRRAAGPLVAFNAGAMPETLAELELFGARRGAYTGADRDHRGLFLEADGGTLFIDELGAMSPALQGKLLRVAQDGEVLPLGTGKPVRVDVRLVTALNENPLELVQTGRLRKDLYYRLSVVRIPLPPLRERVDDIPLLAELFLTRAIEAGATRARRLSPRALRLLIAHEWPGNVRELANVVERAALLCEGDEIDAADIAFEEDDALATTGGAGDLPYEEAKRQAIERFQRRYVDRLLAHANGNISAAARAAGMTRAALQRILKHENPRRS
jgi:DNA-binding NtrC family response regulator